MKAARIAPADRAVYSVQTAVGMSRVPLDINMSPELVRRHQEGTLAPEPWYVRHPVWTVAGVLAAGGLVWLGIRHMRRE